MDKERLINEANYFVTMDFAKKMLDKELITKEIFEKFKKQMVKKYSPMIDKLNTK